MKWCSYTSMLLLLSLPSLCRGDGDVTVEIGNVPIEYLSDCKLEHGIVELPHPGSPKSIQAKGYIFNFAKRQLAIDPLTLADKEPDSFEEFRQAIIKGKTGDLYFKNAGDDPVLVAVSGRIQNLGATFLYQFSGKELPEPKQAVYTEEGEKAIGILTDVKPGNCYLMHTLEDDVVLFRLVSLGDVKRSCTIQWVKKIPGESTFDIPKGAMIQARATTASIIDESAANKVGTRRDSLPAISTKPLDRLKAIEVFCKDVEVYLVNRKVSISMFMNVLNESSSDDTYLMAVVINALGEMRAVEAAPLMATIIDTHAQLGPSFSITIDNMFGCVPALVKIGKPGAAACLEAIALLPASQREKRPFWEKLLCLVMLRVEGKDVTHLLLEQRKVETSDAEQIANLDRAIGMLDEVVSWGGVTPAPRPRIDVSALTTKRAMGTARSDSSPAAETGLSALAYVLIGVGLAVIGVGLTLVLRKKLRRS